MQKRITAKQTKHLFSLNQEISLIDVREIGLHASGHPFYSISIPYSFFNLLYNRITLLNSSSIKASLEGPQNLEKFASLFENNSPFLNVPQGYTKIDKELRAIKTITFHCE